MVLSDLRLLMDVLREDATRWMFCELDRLRVLLVCCGDWGGSMNLTPSCSISLISAWVSVFLSLCLLSRLLVGECAGGEGRLLVLQVGVSSAMRSFGLMITELVRWLLSAADRRWVFVWVGEFMVVVVVVWICGWGWMGMGVHGMVVCL